MRNEEEIKYVIQGNENYYISLNDEVIGFDDVVPIPIINGKVSIPLYGILYKLDLEWLLLYAKFNVRLPKGYTKHIENIMFKPYSLESHKVVYDHLVLFKEPVYYKDNKDYRLLAMYPEIAINEYGDTVNVITGKYNFPNKYANYKSIVLYQAQLATYKPTLVHRLVALAWVDNDDFVAKPIVDHIDGSKANCYRGNLQWVSFSENNRKTAEQGLRSDNIEVKVKDYKNNSITIFGSMTQACKFMNRARINRIEDYCKTPKLINKRYQIKLLHDNSEWDFDEFKGIKIDFGKGVKEYNTLREVMRDLFPDISVGQNRDYVIKKMSTAYPNAKIYFPTESDKVVNRMYQARDCQTKKVVEGSSLRDLATKLGLAKGTITKAFHLREDVEVCGYAVREKSDKPWKEITKHISSKITAIVVKNLKTGVSSSFSSIRSASTFLNVDKKYITTALKNNTALRGYLISKK